MGQSEELPPQGRQRRRWRRLPRPEAQERHARQRNGSRLRLYRKANGREARLSYMGHVVMENRNGLAVAGRATEANGTAECSATEDMLAAARRQARRRITAGEDKAYDNAAHVAALREIGVTPHVAQNTAPTKTGKRRRSAIDRRTTRHAAYGMSQSRRAMIECIFGWGKQHGTMRRTKHRGLTRVAGGFLLNLIAYTWFAFRSWLLLLRRILS